jgi:hypothetical protein
MKKLVLSLLLAVLPLALFGASGTAIPGGNQAAPYIINKSGAYYLAANRVMTTKGQAAIQIDASDVTLDLNGYTLSYADIEGAGYGITVTTSNVEIRNGSVITVPYAAISASGGTGVRIIDVRLADTGGIRAFSYATLIERCHIIDSHGSAVNLGGWASVLKDCHIRYVQPYSASGLSYGVYVSTYCKAVGNHIGYTDGAAIYCAGSYAILQDNQVVEANKSKANDAAGILVFGSNVSLRGNTVHDAAGMGIKITEQASGCMVDNNLVCRTSKTGALAGAGIVSQHASTLLRGNLGSGNAGGLTAGNFVNGGGNQGN